MAAPTHGLDMQQNKMISIDKQIDKNNGQLVIPCIVHLADSANFKDVTFNKLCTILTGPCIESPNDTIHVTVIANFKTDNNDNLTKFVNKINKKGEKMKKGLILIATVFLIASCNQTPKDNKGKEQEVQTTQDAQKPKDGVFIHIKESYNDPHKVLMPMKMAVMMAEDKDVLVYMDINAVELLVKGAKDLDHKDFDTFQTYLKQLLEKNVGVYACPTCLKIAGFSPEDLLEGVQTAQKDKFFNFTQGRIITLDY